METVQLTADEASQDVRTDPIAAFRPLAAWPKLLERKKQMEKNPHKRSRDSRKGGNTQQPPASCTCFQSGLSKCYCHLRQAANKIVEEQKQKRKPPPPPPKNPM